MAVRQLQPRQQPLQPEPFRAEPSSAATGKQLVLPTLIALPTFPPELMSPVEIAPPFAAADATPPLPADAMSVTLVASPPWPPMVVARLLLPALASEMAVPAFGVEIDDGLVRDVAAIDSTRRSHPARRPASPSGRPTTIKPPERDRNCRTQNHTREFHLRRSSPSLTG